MCERERERGGSIVVRVTDGAVMTAVWLDDLTAIAVADGAITTDRVDWQVCCYLSQESPAVDLYMQSRDIKHKSCDIKHQIM